MTMRKILVKAKHCGDRTYFDIEHLTKEELDGEDYDRGSMETIEATATNNSRAIGRLLDLLYKRDVIDLGCIRIILGYGDDVTIEEIK